MKILICYDGTENSIAINDDLIHAGLGDGCEAVVFTVAEAFGRATDLAEAEALAREAATKLRHAFPSWVIETRCSEGLPAREILSVARELNVDMIVVDEPADAPNRQHIFLGQTTSIIVNEVPCSVRIARRSNRDSRSLVLGFDGSPSSVAAIDEISNRQWPTGTNVKLIVVADSFLIDIVGRFAPQMSNMVVESRFVSQWASTLAATAISRLETAGIEVDIEVKSGRPQSAIVDAAEKFGANCIFVGPHNGPDSFARFVVGSVSASVAKHADCSVEIVRTN